MPGLYARFDVSFPDDPKVIDAGDLAELVYVRCVLRSRAQLTDGFVDRRAAPRWCAGIRGKLSGHFASLVKAGLLVEVDGGWQIPDRAWRRWNPTASEVDEKREAEAERKRSYREAKMSHGDTDGRPEDVPPASGVCPGQPEPEPEPEPEPSSSSLTGTSSNGDHPATDDDDPIVAALDLLADRGVAWARSQGTRFGNVSSYRAQCRINAIEAHGAVLQALAVRHPSWTAHELADAAEQPTPLANGSAPVDPLAQARTRGRNWATTDMDIAECYAATLTIEQADAFWTARKAAQ